MRKGLIAGALAVALMTLSVPALAGWAPKDSCLACHPREWNQWVTSGHPFALRTAEEARSAGLPLPEGYAWNDISHVIGGRYKKTRYADQNGYLITRTGPKNDQPGKNQYNLETGRWVDYEAGRQLKYDCGSCHTTGYEAEGRQNSMEGAVGTWKYGGITCERCHKPAAGHVTSGGDKAQVTIERSPDLCGKCHIRGEKNKIPARDGFIQHNAQFNEQQSRKMHRLNCVECHNPHLPALTGIRKQCVDCHAGQGKEYEGSVMQKAGVACKECHMPKMVKSAESFGPYVGDMRAHLFAINTDPAAGQFTADGAFANNYITVEFACLGCHQARNRDWALKYAKGVHKSGR